MNYIDIIHDIPEFLKRYLLKDDYTWLEESIHSFSQIIMSLQFHPLTNDGMKVYVADIFFPDTKFLDFYFSKIRIDNRGFCEYEEELNLPESIRNELFRVQIGDRLVNLYLDSYKENRITFIEIEN